jgi:DNA polymerase (family 10)
VDVAEQLELLADLLEIEGEASFRVLAYRRAATRIRETAGSVAELALAGRAKELQGIGKTIEEKIVQVVEDGEMHALTKRKKIIPPEVVSFMRLPGLGPKTAARIWQELGVTTIDELKRAAEQEQLRTLAGLGAKTEERILKALAEKKQEPSDRRLLGDGLGPLLAAVEVLQAHPAAVKVSEAGSARRRKETFRVDRPLHQAEVGDRGGGERPDQGHGVVERRPALRPARGAARVIRKPAPALHWRQGPQRRAA